MSKPRVWGAEWRVTFQIPEKAMGFWPTRRRDVPGRKQIAARVLAQLARRTDPTDECPCPSMKALSIGVPCASADHTLPIFLHEALISAMPTCQRSSDHTVVRCDHVADMAMPRVCCADPARRAVHRRYGRWEP